MSSPVATSHFTAHVGMSIRSSLLRDRESAYGAVTGKSPECEVQGLARRCPGRTSMLRRSYKTTVPCGVIAYMTECPELRSRSLSNGKSEQVLRDSLLAGHDYGGMWNIRLHAQRSMGSGLEIEHLVPSDWFTCFPVRRNSYRDAV
ncbi:hypothetical protein MAR_011441 [Mya arenaria]|uniref:HNH endonuclease n=1 Tax=Mya arenaria TaxID=6604 RepID=A0ABY7FXH4_MYAAR|nr:hypothetical protein MAR_011441 [Mya arenaria]